MKYPKLILFILYYNLLFYSESISQQNSLRINIQNILDSFDGKVGIGVMKIENEDSLFFFPNDKFPMQSVYKFHLALAVLDKVDKGWISLDQNILIHKSFLLPNTWSPLREKYPDGDVYLTLDEILSYTISQSDNNGCDILFRLLGNPKAVEDYIHSIGITDVSIAATEEEMHESWDAQFTNWTTPYAMSLLLTKFFNNEILSTTNTEYLWNLMVNTSTGLNRIKGLLPDGTIVAHKTGSSGTNKDGVSAATNDAGIVTLPDGKHYAITVFVSNSKADQTKTEEIIAKISKVVWDNFVSKNN